jgi:DNA-nicking Smr family endonuclease
VLLDFFHDRVAMFFRGGEREQDVKNGSCQRERVLRRRSTNVVSRYVATRRSVERLEPSLRNDGDDGAGWIALRLKHSAL